MNAKRKEAKGGRAGDECATKGLIGLMGVDMLKITVDGKRNLIRQNGRLL